MPDNDLEFLDAQPEPQPSDDGGTPAVAEPVAGTPEPVSTEPEEPLLTDEEYREHQKKKTGSQREKERRIKAEAELELLRAQLKPQEAAPAAPAQIGKPKPEDFDTNEEFTEALTDWKVDQKLAQVQHKTEAQKQNEAWSAKLADARTRYKDFDETIAEAPSPSPIVAGALLKHSLGADIGYYLATHVDEYHQLNRMLDPVEVAFKAAEIAAKVQPGKPKQTSNAPRPPTPVTAPPVTGAKKAEGRHEVY